ncbi:MULTISPECIES: peptidoglycan-binding protein LysM [unclassified Salipiger]|uniref:peptidoglycan-binding protein LysM n=1 Tax=unclassified Salipiger TaxID=2640570 RepID=UPI0013B79580|nr:MULTISPECIES: peptidoglycan-binding protein LysM [unclassified Salipiger]NDV51316.1 peptidoglycan-binding protein LysM [Salipiger sp. PrR003]NDW31798.1 peptidoglycan-binding protein LysM [Salipiger sp. PrR007]
MGLFSFLKGKGKKLGTEATPAKAELEAELDTLGLDKSGVEIEVEPESSKVKIKGQPKDQETREKMILAVGNIEGVAEVEDEADGPAPVFHEVKEGENLWKIAEATLGDGARYSEIFEANKPMLSDPDKIYPGQVLRIPA